MPTYEGWINWETWLVNLTLDNDEPLYRKTRELAKNFPTVPKLAAAIQNFVEHSTAFGFAGQMGRETVATQVLQTFLDEVEWADIAKAQLEKD